MSETTGRPAATPADANRRAAAVAGAICGAVVVLVLAGVFVVLRSSGGHVQDKAAASLPSAAATPEAPASSPAPEPSASPAAPAAVNTPPALRSTPVVKPGTGTVAKLTVTYLVRGKGAKVTAGDTVTTNYVLVAYKTGQVLDSSWKNGQTFSYTAGAGDIIQGWDRGLTGVPTGSRVQLDVPAALAYGAQQGDLRFVVDVLAATKSK